jgi:predicted phage terminase large subunit-like protein
VSNAWAGHAARRFSPKQSGRWLTPGAMARDLDPRTVQTPALDRIDAELTDAFHTPDSRRIITMPPQEGKSQRASRWFPLWALEQNHDLRIIIVSYEAGMARRHGRWVRDQITRHQRRLRMAVKRDVSAQHEWELSKGEGGIVTAGTDGAVTGRPGDLIIIDDPIKNRKEADSPTVRETVWDFWTDSLATRLSPGAPVVLIQTRWHHDDLAGRLLAAEDGHLWKMVNIPAEADHDPEQGETDPLGREPGEYMISARGRTAKQWDAIKIRSGPRTWEALYQGHPGKVSGSLFKIDKWQRYATPLWIVRPDGKHVVLWGDEDASMCQSWDFTFKDKTTSDYVVGQVWLRRGVHMYLLDQVRDRMSFTQALQAMKDMTAKWPQAVAKYVEDKANGPAIINALQTEIFGMVPIEPEGSKYARAEAVSPLQEAGNLHLPEAALCPWIVAFTDEHKDFPNGKNDDQVDATSQAVNRELLWPILQTDESQHNEAFEELYAGAIPGYSISPY